MDGKNLGGRPVKCTPALIEKMRQEFLDYLYKKNDEDEYVNQVPNVSEFAFEHGISRQRIYEFEELREVVELCKTKKERDLEVGALSGALNTTMAIFSLKQMGWTDRQELEVSSTVQIIDNIPRRKK